MFELVKPSINLDFMGKRRLWLGLSLLSIVFTVALFLGKGLNYGIDFTGGAEVQVKVPQSWDIGKVRDEMESGGLSGVKVQQIGEPTSHDFLVKAQGDEASLNKVAQQVESILGKTLQPTEFKIERVDVVGPAAGESLRMSGYLSMFYALVCILIYVGIRFDYRYAPGAVLSLFHDTVLTVGIFILTQKQFDLQILAALLALIGYSNNDTIIVFDRVRETLHAHPEMSIEQAVNRSINDTLGRTLLTSICTFLTVFSLWIFGGKVIEDFAFTLMVGIVVGTYSSIFIASSILIYITEYQAKRQAALKASGKTINRKRVLVKPEPKLSE